MANLYTKLTVSTRFEKARHALLGYPIMDLKSRDLRPPLSVVWFCSCGVRQFYSVLHLRQGIHTAAWIAELSGCREDGVVAGSDTIDIGAANEQGIPARTVERSA